LLLECSRRLRQLLGKSRALGDEPSPRLKRRLSTTVLPASLPLGAPFTVVFTYQALYGFSAPSG